MSSPSDTYTRLLPLVEVAEAQLAEWMAVNRRPDEHPADARLRYMAERTPARRATMRPATPTARRKEDRAAVHPLTDDGQDDPLWALDHSTRRYRVRPVRPADNAWWVDHTIAVAVFDTQTIDRIIAPVASLPFAVADSDAFAAALFEMRDAWNERQGAVIQ